MPGDSYYITQPRFRGSYVITKNGDVWDSGPYGSEVPIRIASRSRSWENDPNWPKKPHKINPFTYEKTVLQGNMEWESRTGMYVQGDWVESKTLQSSLSGYSMSLPNMTELEADANASAYNKLTSRVRDSDFMLPVSMLEASKTATMVAHTARRMASAALALKRGNLSHFSDAIGLSFTRREISRFNSNFARDGQKAAASAWLEMSYGWSPLLYDIDASARAVANLQQQAHNNRVYVSARSAVNESYSEPYSWMSRQVSANVEVKYGCWLKPPASTPWAEQLGLTGIASTVWEIIPYSFVVDWFLPIGNFLRAAEFSAFTSWQIERGFKVVARRAEEKVSGEKYTASDGGYSFDKRNMTGQYLRIERRPFTTFSPPPPPRLRLPSSFGQAVSAVALLTNSVVPSRIALSKGITTPKALPRVMRIRDPLYYQ